MNKETKMKQVFPANLMTSVSICKTLAASTTPSPHAHGEKCNLLFMELKVLHQGPPFTVISTGKPLQLPLHQTLDSLSERPSSLLAFAHCPSSQNSSLPADSTNACPKRLHSIIRKAVLDSS